MVPDFGNDTSWYADTGATNHVAKNFDVVDMLLILTMVLKLQLLESYFTYIGYVALPSYNYSCRLHLKSILHVLAMTKNLGSVSQLTHDNYVCYVLNLTRHMSSASKLNKKFQPR